MEDPEIILLGQRPVYTPTIDSAFVILGFLDEYRGRDIVQNGDIIEQFHFSQMEVVDAFEEHLHRLVSEHNLTTTVQRMMDANGFIYIISREITDLINTFYGSDFTYEHSILYPDTGTRRRYTIRQISYSIFSPIDTMHLNPEYDARFSYLLGVYQRYGRDRTITFGNATHKAEIVTRLLQELQCPYVAWKMRQDCVPFLHEIEFEPTAELKILFGLET